MTIPGTGQGESRDLEERGDLSRLSPVKWLRLDLNADAWKTPMSLLFLCFAMHLNQAEREQCRMDGHQVVGRAWRPHPCSSPHCWLTSPCQNFQQSLGTGQKERQGQDVGPHLAGNSCSGLRMSPLAKAWTFNAPCFADCI